VPGFFELALDVFDFLIDLLKLDAGADLFALQRLELFCQLAAGQAVLILGQLFRKLLVLGVFLELLVLFVVGRLGFAVIEPIKSRLHALPRPARKVVVVVRPQRQRHQKSDADDEHAAVGFLLFFWVYASLRHPDSLRLPCARARAPGKTPRGRSATARFLQPWTNFS